MMSLSRLFFHILYFVIIVLKDRIIRIVVFRDLIFFVRVFILIVIIRESILFVSVVILSRIIVFIEVLRINIL